MKYREITNGVYSVSVLNPNLRVFDIIMTTDYGTSYNSYIVKGSEKTALIETVHFDFFDNFVENIKELVDINEVEYLIMNHNEPDHSGSIVKLLELLPQLKIVTSQAGALYLKNILNREDVDIITVKDGDTISLGGKTLTFINAPFLHWPDTMFTYLAEDKVAFTCDFLGAHYCEPQIFDKCISYKEAYFKALDGYYQAIFGPFKKYVRNGLEKLSQYDIEYAAVSHGPVLSKAGVLDEVLSLYHKWSEKRESSVAVIPIFYCSAYGNTKLLAEKIKEGILSVKPDAETQCYDLIEHDMNGMFVKLNNCTAFLVGSPTINKDAVAPVWELLSHIDAINIVSKPVAFFGSYGWSGEAIKNLKARLRELKAKVYEGELRAMFVPSENDLQRAIEFGADFANTLSF